MPDKAPNHELFANLKAFDGKSDELNVIIETSKGSRNKYKYDPELGLFKLGSVLPAGAVFPFDFGFVPATMGDDGDPLDVLVLMDDPAFPGCMVAARLIGVIQAEQTEKDGKTERNDRLIAVAAKSHNHRDVRSLDQVSDNLLAEIEHFFTSYNDMKGKEFKPDGRHGPKQAKALVQEGVERFERTSHPHGNSRGGKKEKASAP
jgi:inorganic pyrophosphatase